MEALRANDEKSCPLQQKTHTINSEPEPVVIPLKHHSASSVPSKRGMGSPDEILRQGRVKTSIDADYLSIISSRMMEAVKVSKPGFPRDKQKKARGFLQGSEDPARCASSSMNNPNDYVTPVFSLNSTDILGMVLSKDNMVSSRKKKSTLNKDVKAFKKDGAQLSNQNRSRKNKHFKLRNNKSIRTIKSKHVIKKDLGPEPPKFARRLTGKESEIREQLMSKFTAAASITFARKEICPRSVYPASGALSKTISKSVPSRCKSDSKNVKSLAIGNSLSQIMNVKVAAAPRCSSIVKPSRQNISLADPSRKRVGAVQSMFSSAITKVLQNAPPSKINNILLRKGNKNQNSPVHTGKLSHCPIPVGYGRPSRPGTLPRRASSKIIRHDDDLANGKPPWEIDEESDEDEGHFNNDNVKIEIVVDGLEYNGENCGGNIDEGEDEGLGLSQDPLDMLQSDSEDIDLIKTEVIDMKPEMGNVDANFECDSPFLNEFCPEETSVPGGECEYQVDLSLVDVKPDLTLVAQSNESGCNSTTISNVEILTSARDRSSTINPQREEIVIKAELGDKELEEYII